MLKKFYQLMMDNKDELAKMITAENVSYKQAIYSPTFLRLF